MELKDFIGKIAEQFEITDISELVTDTEFKALEGWSSLMALSIIAMIDDEYGVTIKGKDIRESETIGDLFNIVKSLQ